MKNILVAIPNFNNSKYIEEAIQSVLNQKIPYDYKLDIVVFDNASTDNSVDIINKVIANNLAVSLIINASNIGAIANHNLCIDYAIENNYDYLKVLSSDDVLLKNILLSQVNALESEPNLSVVSCGMIVTDANLNNGEEYRFIESPMEIVKEDCKSLIRNCMIKRVNMFGGPSNFLLRVSNIREIRFSAKYRWLSDFDFVSRLALSDGIFLYLNCPGFLYRRHDNTDSSNIGRQIGLRLREWYRFTIENSNKLDLLSIKMNLFLKLVLMQILTSLKQFR